MVNVARKYREDNEMNKVLEKPALRVLSLDGGGMRGIYTAAFLDRLVAQQAARTGNKELDIGLGFDLICGTSTGAIVASAAAIGCPLGRVVDLYRKQGAGIFPHRITGKLSVMYRVFNRRRFVRLGDRALRSALAAEFGKVTMSDVFKKRSISLSVPTVDMSTHRSWVFKRTPVSGVRDDDYKLVDICMASSAAPIFRSLAAIDNPNRDQHARKVFADGGLWANNPVMVAMTDALAMASDDQPIEIFSLGTCPRPEGEHVMGDNVHRSLLEWRFGADVGQLSISAQEFAYDNMARLLANQFTRLGKSIRTIRFPRKDVPASMMPFLSLDDTRNEAMDRLVEQAHSDANMTWSACDDTQNQDGQAIRSLLESLRPVDPSGMLYASDRQDDTENETKKNEEDNV